MREPTAAAGSGDLARCEPLDRHAGMKAVTPQKFAGQAAVISKAEIELGQLAMQKTQDTQMRNFAQRW